MTIFIFFLFLISTLLAIDTLYSLYNFQYAYFLELKRRHAINKDTPIEHKVKLEIEINNDLGLGRRLIHTTYLIWFILILFTKLILLPVIPSLITFIINSIYKKTYITPLAFFFNLLIYFITYLFTILCIFYRLI